MTFVLVHAVLFAAWIGYNSLPWFEAFDPYPFVFLTLVVSLEAASHRHRTSPRKAPPDAGPFEFAAHLTPNKLAPLSHAILRAASGGRSPSQAR